MKSCCFWSWNGPLILPSIRPRYEVTAVDASSEILKELETKDIQKKVKTENASMQNFSSNERFDIAKEFFHHVYRCRSKLQCVL